MEYTQTTAPSVVPLSGARTPNDVSRRLERRVLERLAHPSGWAQPIKLQESCLSPQQDTHTTPATPSTRWLPNFANMVSVHDLVRP